MAMDMDRHPCFSDAARHKFGRIHLPVAPSCNIQCAFCNRKYDCANESRPGVTSGILRPDAALAYLRKALVVRPDITVVGIAGPGDPFANAEATMETLRLVRAAYPEMLLCVATNGLAVGPHVEELRRLEVSHVTVTMCAATPETGARIYQWAREGKTILRGTAAAELLRTRQIEAIRRISAAGILVKVNVIVVPGVNDTEVETLARTAAAEGAGLLNLMPLFPVPGTALESAGTPDALQMDALRGVAERYLPQMRHCMRCRADAAGFLGESMPTEIAMAMNEAQRAADDARPYVAVASREGALVNWHLGEASYLWIFKKTENGYAPVERRQTPPQGSGAHRWEELGRIIADCRALLVSGMGDSPKEVLGRSGIRMIEMEGLVEEALEAVYEGREIRSPRRTTGCAKGCAEGGCRGSGLGCA